MKPEDVMKDLLAGRPVGAMRMRPKGHPPLGMLPPGTAAEMSPDQYRVRACMDEINAILRRYGCQLIPVISLDPIKGIKGACAIDIMPAQEVPAAAPVDVSRIAAIEEAAFEEKVDEDGARDRIAKAREELVKGGQKMEEAPPDQEA